MLEKQFYNWLCKKHTGGTPNSRLSNCKRVEKHEGDLDNHFSNDKGESLLLKVSYSKDDKRNNQKASHNIPINGDIYNGTATLKQAVNLYFKFKSGEKPENKISNRPRTLRRKKRVDWPIWNYPQDEDYMNSSN